ncbi:Gamma-glutamylputrescine oxidoreductase [Lachnellula suecica]|uniref:Gamma-glutamylputrescine oxidoreductase n=1 Tax=Lachnellula suecica TaxID=602035 RepID=A0A8T9CGS0_9HELO|nr:Gamma-glutamylputrescine oxidoreductase [Lachnellula suecica]
MGSVQTDQQPLLPVANSTTPFWRTELHELDSHRSTDVLPAECDILIIGGGYAGIGAAYHLLAGDEPIAGKTVVLLEAREACSGATGRNGGHLRPSVYPRLPYYIKEYGKDAAEHLADFEFDHVQAIAELVKKEGIDCDFELTRSYDIYTDLDQAQAAKKKYLRYKEAGIAKSTMDDLEWTDQDRAEEVYQIGISGVKGCVGCFTFTAASVWPYKLMMSLLKIAVSKGLNLQTHTPVTAVSPTPTASGTWTAYTPRGAISAKQVIFATNGYTSTLLPEYEGKIVPCRGICSRIVCPAETRPPQLDKTYCIRFNNGSHDYLIPRADGSIVVGGARSTFFQDYKNWYNTVDDASLITPSANYFDTYMQDNFVGWDDSGAKLDQIWTGIMGYNSDSLPSVGEVPGREGCFIAAGFEGHGMPLIWLTMQGIVGMLGGKKYEEVRLPSMFKTTKERLESKRDDLRGTN